MEKELDSSLIKATQVSLGKYVKRPQLSEKLLKKPPFRFLHDIITTVLKTTGFFEGLFEKEELVSDNVKDRESKIQFLNKVISVVGLTTGKVLSAKPSKIVAGQEPEKTNELLQCLAYALDNKLSSVEAVKKFKDEAKPSQTTDAKEKEPSKATKKNADSKKLTSRSSEKLLTQEKLPKSKEQKELAVKNGNRERVSKSKDRESSVLKQEISSKTTAQKSKIHNNKKTQADNSNQAPTSITTSTKELSKVSRQDQDKSFVIQDKDKANAKDEESALKEPDIILPSKNKALSDQDETIRVQLDSSYTIAENELNSSLPSQDLIDSYIKGEEKESHESISAPFGDATSTEEDHREINIKEKEKTIETKELNADPIKNNSFVRKDSATNASEVIKAQDRVTSAHPTENVANVRPTSVRPSSSRPGAPRFRDKRGATEQGAENILMGKVNIIVENTPNEEEEDSSIIIVGPQPDQTLSIDQPEPFTSNEHGHLVQQILDSQKEFSQVNGKTEIEWQFGAQKAREASNQEIEQIRFNIQALSRAANPLGKLLDHIQEDVEVMRQELEQWTRAYEDTSKELAKQKAANEDSLIPLHTKTKQLDADIKERQDKIDDLKIVIHKNSIRIEKLLASGNVQ